MTLGCCGLALAVAVIAAYPTRVPAKPAADPGHELLMILPLPPAHARPGADYGGDYGDGLARSARMRLARRLARISGLTVVDDWPMPLAGVECFVLSVPPGGSAREAATVLSRKPEVAWAQPMNLYRAQSDGSGASRLSLAEPAVREWRLALLHTVSTGRGVRVAVVDSMIDANHPDLAGQVAVSQNFVGGRASGPERHGTAVAGVIAAKGVGIAGIAPGARLMALRACWQESDAGADAPDTICDSLSLAKALNYAIEHAAQVINLSLAGPDDPLLGKLLDVAHARRIVVVAAFDPSLPRGGFPASHGGVVAVTDETAGLAPEGVYGAPGRDVPTTAPGGAWSLASGSSIAAAHVSGLFALLRQRTPTSSGPLKLVAGDGGRAVDACATLLGPAQSCGRGAPLREVLASDHRK
jgi:hypothetical protein